MFNKAPKHQNSEPRESLRHRDNDSPLTDETATWSRCIQRNYSVYYAKSTDSPPLSVCITSFIWWQERAVHLSSSDHTEKWVAVFARLIWPKKIYWWVASGRLTMFPLTPSIYRWFLVIYPVKCCPGMTAIPGRAHPHCTKIKSLRRCKTVYELICPFLDNFRCCPKLICPANNSHTKSAHYHFGELSLFHWSTTALQWHIQTGPMVTVEM